MKSEQMKVEQVTQEMRNNAELLASICQKARHSSASVLDQDEALRDAATMLRTFARLRASTETGVGEEITDEMIVAGMNAEPEKVGGLDTSHSYQRRVVIAIWRAMAALAPKSGWIISNGTNNRWRSWVDGVPIWVNDRNLATRYARREDAEDVHAEDEDAWSVVPFSPKAVAPQGREKAPSFMKPYSDAGHDVASLFSDGGSKCSRCGTYQIDLSEDLAYGSMRKCTPPSEPEQGREENRLPLPGFQSEVADWMLECFGPDIAADQVERADRFTEEALELAQTMPGFTADRAHALVDYVFSRDIGERPQEVGGVMVTLAALCNTVGININEAAETELARVWTKVDAIRAKQAAKPTGSALPIALSTPPGEDVIERVARAIDSGDWANIDMWEPYRNTANFDDRIDDMREKSLSRARAALAAMQPGGSEKSE